ncbi:putative integral membrane protein [Acanthocheilonema viteae]
MSEEEVGRIKAAHRIFVQYRGVVIDDILERKRILLSSLFKWRIGSYLWMIIAMGIFHLKLLHAITHPLRSFLTKGLKTTIYSDGEIRLPRFPLYKVMMVFFALSIIWHCFTWPNPMDALQWNFSAQPQVNFRPQIIPSTHCSHQIKITRSQSETTQCKMSGNLGVDVRLKNIILHSILTVYETIINSLSLASEFAARPYRRLAWKLPNIETHRPLDLTCINFHCEMDVRTSSRRSIA